MLNQCYALVSSLVLFATLLSGKESFVIDASKPYAYLQFDHIGARTPARDKEIAEGIWLRLVNNSSAPIKVRVFDLGTSEPGVGMNYDVVPQSRSLVVNSEGSEPRNEEVPTGYSFDTGSPEVIRPGKSLLFSVPRNHVTPFWHVRIRFQITPPESKEIEQPYTYIEFVWEQIPEKYRMENPNLRK